MGSVEYISIDIGSTFTKGALFSVDAKQVLHMVKRLEAATDQQDISAACISIFNELKEAAGIKEPKVGFSSSAHGGLRMVAIGLVPRYTEKLARDAALSAGAKLCRSYGYRLTDDDIDEIVSLDPDIILLAGGTDGGNRHYIMDNARKLAASALSTTVVFAGNRDVKDDISGIFDAREDIPLYLCRNILPVIDEPCLEEVREVIKQVFIQRIIGGKGLLKASEALGCEPEPTPGSVFSLIERIASTSKEHEDWLLVDIGGATTDCYSVVKEPTRQEYEGIPVYMGGLPEQQVTRTVEGDIGMRHNAQTIYEFLDIDDPELEAHCSFLTGHPDFIPQGRQEQQYDELLATQALNIAVRRHAGSLRAIYSVDGTYYRQSGKDLSKVSRILITGGAARRMGLSFLPDGASSEIRLIPRDPGLLFDTAYVIPLLAGLKEVDDEILASFFWGQMDRQIRRSMNHES